MSQPVTPIGCVLDGRYRIDEQIGEGGMGVVLAAFHVGLGQRVAIKLMRADADPVWRRRFLREAQVASGIVSDHVARVFDVGVTEDGIPFLAMEYLEGRDLADVMDDGPLPIDAAITYAMQACRALEAAHELGIIHRDVKPANLFLTERDDGRPCIKLLDFGISKQDTELGRSLTGTHAVLGSPQFMSPEQLACCRDVDPRADVWSLGATLFELLTGEHAFEGNSLAELCTAIMRDEPRSLASFRDDAPLELEAILSDCLRKDPHERVPSARALEDRLAALRDAPPSSRRLAPASYPSLPEALPAPSVRAPTTTLVMSNDELLDHTPSASVRPVVTTTRPAPLAPPPSRGWTLAGASVVGLLGLAVLFDAPQPPRPTVQAAPRVIAQTSPMVAVSTAPATPRTPSATTPTPSPAAPVASSAEAPSRFSDSGLISEEHRHAIEDNLAAARAALEKHDVPDARSRATAALRRLQSVGIRPNESVSSLGARVSLVQGEIEGSGVRALLAEPLDRQRAERLLPQLELVVGRAQVKYQLVRGWGVASFYRCAVNETGALHLVVGAAFADALTGARGFEDQAWLVKAAAAWLRKARHAYRTALRVPAETTLCLTEAKRGLRETDRVLAALPR